MKELGKADTVTKEYMKDPVIFADVFNQYLYHGRKIIRPENLTEIDSAEITVPYADGRAGVPVQKYRDVLKLMMTDGRIAYCILGCEDQNAIHYAMPVKNMVYDAMQLAGQVTKAAKSHRQKTAGRKKSIHEPAAGEFLSGFYKTDKLLPVVTLVIFFGPEKWDGPLSLSEMYAPADESIMKFVPDYKINLIAPEQMTDKEINEFQTSLKEVMLYIKYSKDKEKLQQITQSDPGFRNLDRQAAEVISITTNSKLKYPEGKERVDMCLAIEEMRNESLLEGEIKGEIKGTVKTCKKFNMLFQETIQYISDNFSVSLLQAEEEVRKYWK